METNGATYRTVALALATGIVLSSCVRRSHSSLTGDDPSVAWDDAGVPTGFGPPDPPSEDDVGPIGACLGSPAPIFPATPVTATTPPPPISGGTLIVTRDGTKAIASDPDRDLVTVVDLASQTVTFTIALQTGDEPGRLAEDGAGRVHVALRGAGALATIDPLGGSVLARRTVCPAPRGVAWQASNDTLWVACATGELASLPASPASSGGGASTRFVERDLRDVILTGDSLAVTEFRSAQVLRLASDGTIARRDTMPPAPRGFASHVAWRAIAGPSGSIVAVHQAESLSSLSTTVTGGYGCGALGEGDLPPAPTPDPLDLPRATDASFFTSADASNAGDDASSASNADAAAPAFASLSNGGGGAVLSMVTMFGSDGSVTLNDTLDAVLPVDVAVSPDGTHVAVIAAGAGSTASPDNLFLLSRTGNDNLGLEGLQVGAGAAIAVAFAGNGEILVQTREPAALGIVRPSFTPGVYDGGAPVSVPLSSASRDDTGHDIFHTHAGAALACASCHPEGGDDGHVWLLDGLPRRTPSLRGTIAGTAPYHWSGDEADMSAIVSDVYVVRMGGGMLTEPQVRALAAWVDAIPAPPPPSWVDPGAAAAGRALFQRSDLGCTTCHSGPKFTNNATVDVGTGGMFQVPPLVGIGWATPLMHSGCATTIADRFGVCATPAHGNTTSLSSDDVANLTAYLETL
jgi:cytochrome c553